MNMLIRISIILSVVVVAFVFFTESSVGQIPRERAEVDEPVTNIFWANTNVGITTVRTDPSGTMNTTVKHSFGLVDGGPNRRGIDTFFGLDDGANTRLGVEYGFTDRFAMGLGRMTFRNVVDLNAKYNILRQTTAGTTPVDLAIYAATGIETLSGTGLDVSDRTSYFASVMAARQFNDLSIQVSPMFGYFNHVAGNRQHELFGIGIALQYELTDRLALSGEYLPVIGERNDGTSDSMGIALNIDTGGHIFQLFFTSSQWHNEQYIMAHNTDRFWEGEFRFGFNIHRVFVLRD